MKKLILFVAVFASVTVLAQRADPRVTALRVAQSFVTPRLATLNAGSALQAGEVVLDDLGQAHVRYQHLYRGVPVFESEAIVHVDLGSETVIDATDALLAFGTIDTQPGLGQAAARGRATR